MSLWSFLRVSPILLPLIIGIYKYKEFGKLKYLFFFVCYGVITEIASKIATFVIKTDNSLFLAHLYAFVSFVFLCLFFQNVFEKYIKVIWFKSLIVCFTVLCTVQLLFFQTIKDYPSLQFSVLAILMVVFSIIYFHKVMVEAKLVRLSGEPMIWISTAMLIYYTGNLFYYILFNLFLDYSQEYFRTIGNYFIVLNTLFYLLIAVGFLKTGKQKTKHGALGL